MYRVIVGNIGTVYEGGKWAEASSIYEEYVSQSKNNYGRAAGEAVTLFIGNEIECEYAGTNQSE